MAIKPEIWAKAKAMFEGGATPDQIYIKTKIERSTLYKKSKKEGWEKGKNSDIITNEVNSLVEKSTLNPQQLEFHEESVELSVKKLKLANAFVNRFDELNAVDGIITQGVSIAKQADDGQGFKAAVEGLDKLSILTGFNQRHAPKGETNINNTNAQQNNPPELVINISDK